MSTGEEEKENGNKGRGPLALRVIDDMAEKTVWSKMLRQVVNWPAHRFNLVHSPDLTMSLCN